VLSPASNRRRSTSGKGGRTPIGSYQRGVELDFSRPGKPTDNAFIESFNGKFRSECLNAHWFLTLDDARLKMEEA
jgi:transposase InsO family protein